MCLPLWAFRHDNSTESPLRMVIYQSSLHLCIYHSGLLRTASSVCTDTPYFPPVPKICVHAKERTEGTPRKLSRGNKQVTEKGGTQLNVQACHKLKHGTITEYKRTMSKLKCPESTWVWLSNLFNSVTKCNKQSYKQVSREPKLNCQKN